MRTALVLCLAALSVAAEDRGGGVPIGTGKQKPNVTITAPCGGWSVGHMMEVAGTVSDRTVDPVVVSINGDRYLIRTFSGRFSREFPAVAGKNIITVSATNMGGTTIEQVTTFAKVAPVPLRAVLTSDTDGVYTDLHIYEPTDSWSNPDGTMNTGGMAHVYWANTESPSGGTFFLNSQGGDFDQPGYGPYLYLHRAPPRGVYLIATNYWPSGDKAHTLATLNLTLFEGTPQEQRRLVKVPLATRGTTKILAWINIVDAGQAQIYAPGLDPPPAVGSWPANLEQAGEEIVRSIN
ncbi:MAG: DUF2135 domain-containing protein [Pseudomonadota bacterium]